MGVDGTWNLTVNGPMGAQQVTLALTSHGDALEGTMSGPQGTIPLEDPKLDGTTLTWSITAAQLGTKIAFTATVDGDTLSGEAELGAFGKASVAGTRA